MAKKTRMYKHIEILTKARRSIRELIALEKEITLYLLEVERRKRDNRAAVERVMKMELNL